MNDAELLSYFRDIAYDLHKTIDGVDYEMERIVHGIVAAQGDVGASISILRERQNAQAGHMYELGKVEARIEDLQNRIREQDEREREQVSVQNWEREMPVPAEDRLAWLELGKVDLTAEREDDEHVRLSEAEDRMLDEMHRDDREPEDYENWRGR